MTAESRLAILIILKKAWVRLTQFTMLTLALSLSTKNGAHDQTE